MNDKDAFEMRLHFTVMDAVEIAHAIGYTEFLSLFQDAFLRTKQKTARELTPEEKQKQQDLLDNWEL